MESRPRHSKTFTLKSALETLHEHNQSSYGIFIDLIKGFDTVNRELLWKVLDKYGVPTQSIKVLKKLHSNVSYTMQIGNKKETIESTVGVKHGDNLGPILFIPSPHSVQLNRQKMGLRLCLADGKAGIVVF